MTVQIVGLATAVPAHRIAQTEAAELIAPLNAQTESEHRVLRELYRRSGVRSRHSVLLEASEGELAQRQSFYQSAEPAADSIAEPSAAARVDRGPTTSQRMAVYGDRAGALGSEAASQALVQAQRAPRAITHLVTVSCTGFQSPGFDIELIQKLGLRPDVARTHVGFMGCHGALNGLRVTEAYARAQPSACVLLVAVELCSLHHQYGWAPDRVVSNALFADGAGAVVAEWSDAPAPHPMAPTATAADLETPPRWSLIANGSLLLPDSMYEMTWRIGDHGFEMTLSPRVPELIRRNLRPWLTEWLARFDLSVADIAGWAIHPGGPRVLTACGEALGLERSQWSTSEEVLGEFGNMSSPTVLFILERLRARGLRGRCVSLAFGPGLSIEAALLNAD